MIPRFNLFLVFIVISTLLFSLPGISGHHGDKNAKKDVVDIASGNDAFSTLVAAVSAADLASVLKGEGPFTVFAPTNEAFSELPEGTVEHLLLPENKEELVKILTYHVVSGKVTASEVVELESAKSVHGNSIQIKVIDGKVMVDNATVTKADIMASNGVIHVIDKVILPN